MLAFWLDCSCWPSHSWDTSIPSTTGRHMFGERGGSPGQASLDSTLSMAPVDGSLLQSSKRKCEFPVSSNHDFPQWPLRQSPAMTLEVPSASMHCPPHPLNWHNHSHLRNTVAVHIRDRPNLWTLCRPNRPTAQESTAWTRAGHTALASALSSTLRQRTDSSARVQKWGHTLAPHITRPEETSERKPVGLLRREGTDCLRGGLDSLQTSPGNTGQR